MDDKGWLSAMSMGRGVGVDRLLSLCAPQGGTPLAHNAGHHTFSGARVDLSGAWVETASVTPTTFTQSAVEAR